MQVPCKNCEVSVEKTITEVKRRANHFCSRSCAATYNNKKYPKRTKQERRPDKACEICETPFVARRPSQRFCSVPCSAKSRTVGGAPRTKEEYNAHMADYMLQRYHRRRGEWLERLGGKCVVCETVEGLEFDHIVAQDKSFNVAKALSGWAETRLEEEMGKCQILCRPCHIKKTNENLEHGKGAVTHGMVWMYRKYKCRCDECCSANTQYNKEAKARYKKKRRGIM